MAKGKYGDRASAGTMRPRTGGGRRGITLLAAGVVIILVWLVLYPNLFVLGDSFMDAGHVTGRHYARFFGSAAELRALWNSVWISLASVVLSALVGVPLAFLFSGRDFP